MANKRKYTEIQGYWVYSLYVPSIDSYYIGMSKQQCSHRWQKSQYKDSSLNQYLDEWDSMIKTVLIDGLTREEALKKEDELIQDLHIKGLCINKRRSGLIASDRNAYLKQRYENDIEYREREKQRLKQYKKQLYQTDAEFRERENQRCRQYYERKKLQKQHNQLTLFDLAS